MPTLQTVVLLAFCLMAIESYAQQKPVTKPKANPKPVIKEVKNDNIFTKVEVDANTDLQKWQQHLKKATQLPDSILQKIPAGEYTAMVQFIVDKYGNMTEIKLESDPGYGLGKIALHVIRSYKGEWRPANQCGRSVNAYRKQPVKFVVE